MGNKTVIVVAHLNAEMVRGIALTPTAGLARGSLVIDRGHSLEHRFSNSLLSINT